MGARIIRGNFDISAYLVIGPENTNKHSVIDVIRFAIEAGFTCVQIRSKIISARELIDLTTQASDMISEIGCSEKVSLLVNDRLDAILAARMQGARVDGIHIGQSDIPVEVCRKYLGDNSIIGVSARTSDLFQYITTADISQIDYFGAGPLHETSTKPDCGLGIDGKVITRSFDEIAELSKASSLPIVVGGGVKLSDIPQLSRTGVDGFFVVSAVAGADNPCTEAKKLVEAWNNNRPKNNE